MDGRISLWILKVKSTILFYISITKLVFRFPFALFDVGKVL